MNDYLLRGALMGQRKNKKKSPEPVVKVMPSETFEGLHWRNIGPFRGGRSCAVTGVSGKPNLFYFGSAGGGIWKTKNGGGAWENISDGYFGGSIGAIAVSEDDPNIIFENCLKENRSSHLAGIPVRASTRNIKLISRLLHQVLNSSLISHY